MVYAARSHRGFRHQAAAAWLSNFSDTPVLVAFYTSLKAGLRDLPPLEQSHKATAVTSWLEEHKFDSQACGKVVTRQRT